MFSCQPLCFVFVLLLLKSLVFYLLYIFLINEYIIFIFLYPSFLPIFIKSIFILSTRKKRENFLLSSPNKSVSFISKLLLQWQQRIWPPKKLLQSSLHRYLFVPKVPSHFQVSWILRIGLSYPLRPLQTKRLILF